MPTKYNAKMDASEVARGLREDQKTDLPFVHEFKGPGGNTFRIKFLGECDATFHADSTKRIITGPGIVMEELTGMSLHQRIVSGCKIAFLADNYAEAAKLAKDRITC